MTCKSLAKWGIKFRQATPKPIFLLKKHVFSIVVTGYTGPYTLCPCALCLPVSFDAQTWSSGTDCTRAGFEIRPKPTVGLPSKLMPSLDAPQVRSEVLSIDGMPCFLPSSLLPSLLHSLSPSFLLANIIAHIFLPLLVVVFHLGGRMEDALLLE